VERRPKILAAAALLVMLVLSIPFASLRLGSSDQGNDPASTTTRKAYDLLAQGFGPGFNGPLMIVAPVCGTAQQSEWDHVLAQIAAQPDVAAVTPARVLGQGGTQVAVASVYPKTSP